MSLAEQIREKHESALKSNALVFFETTKQTKASNGVQFEITYAPALGQKPTRAPDTDKKEKVNPFLPPDPALLVTDLNDHRIVLNKFCIVPHHILVITKEFKPQTQPLFPNDLAATWQCLTTAYDGASAVAFYNCGSFSGASQPHKHVQVIPTKGAGQQPPIKALFNEIRERKAGQIYTLNRIPFVHVLVPLDRDFIESSTDPEEVADYLSQMFFGLLDAMFQQLRKHATPQKDISYNFIMTQQFMFIVPRSKENCVLPHKDGQVTLSINSLAFAGMLLVKSQNEMDALLEQPDVMELLLQVTFPWDVNAEDEPEM